VVQERSEFFRDFIEVPRQILVLLGRDADADAAGGTRNHHRIVPQTPLPP
jgi:hypothetical protein